MEPWTALALGFFGSLHCVGMCGPLALALPGDRTLKLQLAWGRLLYNLGRVVTYAALGAIIGLFGQGIAMSGYQQGLSIALGTLLVIMALFSIRFESKLMQWRPYQRFRSFIMQQLGSLFQKHSSGAMFTIGLLNGLLPCGFVYFALAGTLTTSHWLEGMAYMALFGSGTIPLMLATSMIGGFASIKARNWVKRATPVVMLAFGALFILRGMNLDIPYISPKLEASVATPHKCH